MKQPGQSSERPRPSPCESHQEMCKIKIIETGRSKKSRSESFACPHPTPLPAALPPPPPPPSASVNVAPRTASQEKTEQGSEAQEKLARDNGLQKLDVHHPATTADGQKSNARSPNRIIHIPYIYARTPKTIAQVKVPKKPQAQHQSIPKPVTEASSKEKNAAIKSGKHEKPIVAAPAGNRGASSNGNKKAASRRVTSTKQNRLPERVELTNLDVDESETGTERIRRTGIYSPSRNVRFAIGESPRPLSTTSSSSTSSEDSFIDPHPHITHTIPNSNSKQSGSTSPSRNLMPSYFANMEENDAMESDDSSNIDAGGTLGSRMSWEDTESFRDLGPAKSQSRNMHRDLPIRTRKTASSISQAVRHDHMSVPAQSPTIPDQLVPEQDWETMSDQESAIDPGSPIQTPMSEKDINHWDWMQRQSSDETSGFNAWINSLVASQRKRNSSRPPSPKGFKEPIFVYQTKSKRLAKTEKEPLLAIKKSPHNDENHHTYIGGPPPSETKRLEPPETAQATKNPSYRPPSAVEVAEQPVHYNPGLQIFWRDV